jgi:MFS family permease
LGELLNVDLLLDSGLLTFIHSALADKYGRRWPLMIDIVLFSLINMASGFAPNLQTFIGLRAVFGIAMGGEWVRRFTLIVVGQV